ncbi:MAG TPA: hypothetical protein VLM36_13755 [Sphingomicrobium sp.]|nr:hypothetical protein [Sphingomicrobium sp.]
MRSIIAIVPLILLGACQVSKDNGNGTVSVTYNSDEASNVAADVGNTAQNIAGDIGNDVKKSGDKIENRVGNANVNVSIRNDSETENKSAKK